MPRGRYSLHDPHDHTPLGEEHFHCAPGPSGWRYVSQLTAPGGEHRGSVDLAIDELGAHPAGGQRGELAGARRRARRRHLGPHRSRRHRATEGNIAAPGFTGTSPAFLIATSRLLRLAPGGPETRVRLLALTDPVLAPRTVDQAWALLRREEHPTDSGPLLVDEYRVSALDTGEVHTVHIAGDVVLSAPGIELEHLETPPSAFEEQ